jgi:hypothetical protein
LSASNNRFAVPGVGLTVVEEGRIAEETVLLEGTVTVAAIRY